MVGIFDMNTRVFHRSVAIAVFLRGLFGIPLGLVRLPLGLMRLFLGLLRLFLLNLGSRLLDDGLAFEILLEHRRKAAATPRPAQRSGQSLPTGEERKGLCIA